MNYTLIAHTEDSSYHDRCGDYNHQPGAFEIFYTTDRDEAVKKWADWSFSGGYDTLEMLINGVPSSHLGDDLFEVYDKLGDDRATIEIQLQEEKKLRDQKAAEEKAAKALREAELRDQLQRQKDLDTLNALKKKLGVS